MIITNKHGLPDTLMALATSDNYSKGDADYSVTEIISPARIARLRRKHYTQMTQDVSDMMWQLLGSALHVVAEKGQTEGYITEERLYAEIDGVILSGAIDIQKVTPQGIEITDYKFTSAWSLRQDKFEWDAQQNIYAYLVRRVKKLPVTKVQICALVRDWSRREAAIKPSYPQSPIVVIDLKMWTNEETERYIRERLNAHRDSKVSADWNEELPPCDESERWSRDTQYAVKREGRKTAIRVLDNAEAAEAMALEEKGYVEVRKGESVRCTGNYCGVNQWCSQYQQSKEVV
tara:strand:+ start:2387 stop:3256 length:870 start_codon:yes stop_codon:yes gene_type:complete